MYRDPPDNWSKVIGTDTDRFDRISVSDSQFLFEVSFESEIGSYYVHITFVGVAVPAYIQIRRYLSSARAHRRFTVQDRRIVDLSPQLRHCTADR